MIRLMLRMWLVLAALSLNGLAAGEMKLEKAGNGLRLSVPESADIDVVAVGEGRWAIVVVVGNPPRLQILYLRLESAPPPKPQLPEATRLAREWLSLVSEGARARAPALAAAFRAVADDIDAGKLHSAPAIIQASTERNRAAVAEDRNAWLSWFEKLREYMNGLADSGKLNTPQDHAKLFREIAAGLIGQEGTP